MSNDQTPSRDPLYFGRWFAQLLRHAASEIGEGGSVSELPERERIEIMEGIRYLGDLDNAPIEHNYLSVTRSTDNETGRIVYIEAWYSVEFPWSRERQFANTTDRGAFTAFAKGDMAKACGLLDLAMCIDIWLSDGMRKPNFFMRHDHLADVVEPASDRKTIRTKKIVEKFGIPKSSFYDLVVKSGIQPVTRGMYDLSEIKKLLEKNGYSSP